MAAAAVGASVGALGGVLGAALGAAPAIDPAVAAASAVLGASMAAIAIEDAQRFRVPDVWVYGALVCGLAWTAWWRLGAGEGLAGVAAGPVAAAVCGGVFLAVREVFFRLRGSDGLGLGDVKLAAAGGAWLGWEAFALAVLVAAVGALAFVATRALRGRVWPREKRLAFGAFLAPAIWATWLVVGVGN